jgi:hypothetical protein
MRLLPENPPNITERAVRRAWTVVGVLAVIVLVVTVIGLVRLSDSNESLTNKVEQSDADRAELSERLDREEADSAKQKKASVALAAQVERLGGKPVVDPANPSAPPVALGPTNAQVRAAIKVICVGEQSLCSPTQAQVKVALAAICGDCRGEDAETPANGRDGNDGQDGPGATDAQIDAAVARVCAEDGCRGPGPTDQQVDERIAAYCTNGGDCGQDGKDGANGSVTPGDYTCPDGQWITAIHVAEGGAMTVDCSPLIGRGD